MLPSDAATTLPTFLYELNYANPSQKTHPPPPLRGSFQCVSHCSTCTYISNRLTAYTFHSKGKRRPGISHHIICNSKNLSLHDSVQTLSQAIYKRLTKSFNEHRRPVDKLTNISKPSTLSEHFPTDHHTTNDISPIPLKPACSLQSRQRKQS